MLNMEELINYMNKADALRRAMFKEGFIDGFADTPSINNMIPFNGALLIAENHTFPDSVVTPLGRWNICRGGMNGGHSVESILNELGVTYKRLTEQRTDGRLSYLMILKDHLGNEYAEPEISFDQDDRIVTTNNLLGKNLYDYMNLFKEAVKDAPHLVAKNYCT